MKWCFSTRVMVDGIPFLTVEMNRKSWTENNVPPLSSLMPESIITGCWLLGGWYAMGWDLYLPRGCWRLSRCGLTLMKQPEANQPISQHSTVNHRRSREWWHHHQDSPSELNISWWLSWWTPPQASPAGTGVVQGCFHWQGLACLWGSRCRAEMESGEVRSGWEASTGCMAMCWFLGSDFDLLALSDRSVFLCLFPQT